MPDERNRRPRRELPTLAEVLAAMRAIGRPCTPGEIAKQIGRSAGKVGEVLERSTASIRRWPLEGAGHRWLVEPVPSLREHWPEWRLTSDEDAEDGQAVEAEPAGELVEAGA